MDVSPLGATSVEHISHPQTTGNVQAHHGVQATDKTRVVNNLPDATATDHRLSHQQPWQVSADRKLLERLRALLNYDQILESVILQLPSVETKDFIERCEHYLLHCRNPEIQYYSKELQSCHDNLLEAIENYTFDVMLNMDSDPVDDTAFVLGVERVTETMSAAERSARTDREFNAIYDARKRIEDAWAKYARATKALLDQYPLND